MKIVSSPNIREIDPKNVWYLWRVGFKKEKSFEMGKKKWRVMDGKTTLLAWGFSFQFSLFSAFEIF